MSFVRFVGGRFSSCNYRALGPLNKLFSSPIQDIEPLKGLVKTQWKCFHVCSDQRAKTKEKVKKGKAPLDDVYLEHLYEPPCYALEKAISTLKRYMELDLADKKSPIRLKLDLHLAPKGKGKHQTFWQITDPVHNFDYPNKVCAFTDDAELIKQCLEIGAHAGGHDVIQKVLFGKEQYDAFISTPLFHKASLHGNTELTKALGKLVPTRTRGLNEDLVAELLKMKEGIIIHNQGKINTNAITVIGLVDQPVSHIQDNVEHVMGVVRRQQNPKHPPIIKGAMLTCCHESLNFEVIEDDDD